MTAARALAWALAAAAGALSVLGYAPFGIPALPLVALAVLFASWNAAATPRAAAAQGFAFGLGLFGAGVSWVFIALSGFGEMPPVLAGIATAAFVAYLSLWPALAGWLVVRVAPPGAWRFVACAGAWTATEWLRGYVFTGMPWLSLGYSQWPGSPLAAYAPVGGVFLVSLAGALTAACIAWAIEGLALGRARAIVAAIVLVAVVAAGGAALARVEWTTPAGAPLSVSLVQGDIGQDVKFDRGFRERTFEIYGALVKQSRGRLVVLPESAFPMFADQVPEQVVAELARAGAERDGLVLLGLFTAQPPLPGTRDVRYYNTVAALGAGDVGLYRKRHLVPFGESIPLKGLLSPIIDAVLQIPLADQTAGDADQPPFVLGEHRIAVNICYEDAFGSELIDAARAADVLVNVTNDAWYGHSVAAYQHDQIAAMRALELGRPMLRATNTGITSFIDADGRERARLPWFTRGVLEIDVRGRSGLTPYARVGDAPAVALGVALIALPALAARRERRTSA
ncbi:MAG TPA: apolipoprotein N-acyltransferase [Casimicrobiaceae bacterium]|jgi:apolipoprotein N-acyltransferase